MTTLIPKFQQIGTGAVNRAIDLKLAESVSVKDFGAVGDGVANDTAAFAAAMTAAYKIYVPAGTYKVTEIVAPNKITVLEGDSSGGSIINTTGAVGLDYQHYTNVYGSRNSEINNIQVVAAAGTTALRVNNLGLNINNSKFYGGQIGIDLNMMVNAKWDTVYAAGSAAGIKVWNSTFNPSVDGVVWQNSFVNIIASGDAVGTGFLSAGGFAAFMRQNVFINMTTQSSLYGMTISNNSSNQNTFINWWAEANTGYDINEGTDNINTYINPHYISVGVTNTFNANSWIQAGNQLTPESNGGNALGYIALVSGGDYRPRGVSVVATNNTASNLNLIPANITTLPISPSTYKYAQDSTFYFAAGKATGTDLFSVSFPDRASGFITVELAGYGSTQGGCKYTRYFSPSGGGYSFETVGTDFISASANCSLTFTATGTNAFKVTYATTIAAHNFGIKVTVDALSAQTAAYVGSTIALI